MISEILRKFNQNDHDFLTYEVPNLSGLAVFSYKKLGGSKNLKFYRPAEDLAKLTGGDKIIEVVSELNFVFNPLSFIIGFSTPFLPPFIEHDHFRAEFAEQYVYNNVLTIGYGTKKGTLLKTRKNQLILNEKFCFSFHNKELHTLRVINEVVVFFIMDDVDPNLILKNQPECHYL